MEKGSRGKRLACFSPSLSSASPFLVRACVSRSLPCTARRLFLLFLSFRFLALAMTGQFVPAAPHQPTHLVSSHTCTLRCPERTCSSSSSSSASLASARRVSSSALSFAAPSPPLALHCTCAPRPTVTCPSRRTTSSARPTCPPSASTLFVPPHPFLPPCLPPPTLTHTPLQTENEDAHHRGPPRQAPDRLHSPCIHTPTLLLLPPWTHTGMSTVGHGRTGAVPHADRELLPQLARRGPRVRRHRPHLLRPHPEVGRPDRRVREPAPVQAPRRQQDRPRRAAHGHHRRGRGARPDARHELCRDVRQEHRQRRAGLRRHRHRDPPQHRVCPPRPLPSTSLSLLTLLFSWSHRKGVVSSPAPGTGRVSLVAANPAACRDASESESSCCRS